ncbi:MAG: DNA polymerase III subunit epsilon [Hydrogenophilales bacterium 28-61-23]|nr:MAG: DNA polymerase III subunit epsilon [Hydrogenophilales bacterium 28-61-23]
MRQIVLDTETTGLDPAQGHRVIEIGALEILNRRITGATYHVYLNPERDIDAGALAVHGLSREFLSDKPRFSDVAPDFLEFVRDAELVIHNAPFDIGFLNSELSRIEDGPMKRYCEVLDTLKLAKQLHPGQKNNLDALCRRYFVDNAGRTFHGALLDAQLLAEVYLAMTRGQETLGIDIGQPTIATDVVLQRKSSGPLQLKVQRASEAEVALHGAYLAGLAKECGEVPAW